MKSAYRLNFNRPPVRRVAPPLEEGAQEILVETDNFRNAAFALYESVGFRILYDVLVFRKDYVA
jgi:hypothetical protein